MPWLLDLRLIVFTAGTLLPFFWMVVILGHRRQRRLERIFFFLCLALTCFFGSSLLALNGQLFYATPPPALLRFAWVFLSLGLWLAPSLLLDLHAEFASLRGLFRASSSRAFWLALAYLPGMALLPRLFAALGSPEAVDFERPARALGLPFRIWLLAALLLAAYWEERFARASSDAQPRSFHRVTSVCLGGLGLVLGVLFCLPGEHQPPWIAISAVVAVLAIAPLGLLVGGVGEFNFLEIGRQRNLIYAVFAVFLALLYLSLVRRAGQWLEPFVPPEATAALLLFLPVVFFEPLQRLMRRLLRQTAQSEVDRAQKLMGPINEAARSGDRMKLRAFAERWIAEQLQLAEVRLVLDAHIKPVSEIPRRSASEATFEIHRGSEHLGILHSRSHGAMMSGETFAALEFVGEQLPAAFDLCRLIEEKLQLERELAERERLALVGQMAASISHNLKNPLGSIKTILQLQMENPELPASIRKETQMVLDEIRRLSEKLNQLLQFSRPGAPAVNAEDRCDIIRVAHSVAAVFHHEAEQRGVVLELQLDARSLEVSTGAEVAHDILSNLVLNAIEAAPAGGHVRLWLVSENGHCQVSVEDDGPGIPGGLKEQVLQPFFTTKARGTGLGLAIVERRLQELGGNLCVESPIQGQRGSRFRVALPLVAAERMP
jgi:signal transduction histidine kinase